MSDDTILNARLWGDQQNRSYLPVSGRFVGDMIWKQPPAMPAEAASPLHLCKLGESLAVWHNGRIDLRAGKNGVLQWTTPVAMNAHFEASSTGFVTVDEVGYYRELDLQGELGKRVTLPFLEGEGFLHLVRRIGSRIHYAYQLPSQEISDPDEEWVPPQYAFASVEAGGEDVSWMFARNGQLLAALIQPEGQWGCLAAADKLYLLQFPSAGERPNNEALEPEFREVPTGSVIAVAYDHQGQLLLIDKVPGDAGEPDEMQLSCLSAKGEVVWRLSLGDPQAPPTQPPASSPGGDVWIAVGKEVWRVHKGERVWSADLPVAPGKILLTVLADESVLVAADTTLLQLSSSGEQLRMTVLDEPMTCRPIMDEHGRVYVAGSGGVYCLR